MALLDVRLPRQVIFGEEAPTTGPELAVSSNGRFLVDAANDDAPFLMNGVAAWSLFAQLDPTEVTTFLDHCEDHNVNFLWISAVEAWFSSQTSYSGRNYNNASPWTGTKWQSSFNSAYWDYVESILEECASRGIVVQVFPCYYGNGGGGEGWWSESAKAAGSTNMQNYGANLGSVLNSHPNVVVAIGGDYWVGFDNSPSSSANLAIQTAIVTGLKSTDRSSRIYTAHWSGGTNSIDTIGSDPGQTWTDFNCQYDIFTSMVTTAQCKAAYQNSPTRPTYFGEGYYWGNDGLGAVREYQLRIQYYRSFCWGAFGHTMGDEGVWPFDAPTGYRPDLNWVTQLGRPYWDHLAIFHSVVGSRAWNSTVPDYSHTVVTSGQGTDDTAAFCPVRSSSSLLIGYCPQGATLTINQGSFSGNINIRKIDPTNGAVTNIATNVSNSGSVARAFTGSNAAGESDWIALVELA